MDRLVKPLEDFLREIQPLDAKPGELERLAATKPLDWAISANSYMIELEKNGYVRMPVELRAHDYMDVLTGETTRVALPPFFKLTSLGISYFDEKARETKEQKKRLRSDRMWQVATIFLSVCLSMIASVIVTSLS